MKALFQTVTFNNEREFAWHKKIAAELGGEVCFTHPYSRWERGTNENTNGLLRQYFPKDCDFSSITDTRIQEVQDRLNNRPRECLGIKTPNQLLFGIDSPVALGLLIQE